jgi:putative oxygen-independent coproporphyrinogen III oxidase
MLELPPLSLYVHIPWCDYVSALCDDFDRELDRIEPRTLQSIFIGGGTPSLFGAAAYERLLNHIQKWSALATDIEITLEANPGTAEAIKFKAFRATGINRLSLGIQSFDDRQLQNLGRIHDGNQARMSIDIARQSGFENINLDLMHGLPAQESEVAIKDLATALSYQPQHISWYQLTIEPNTVFYRHPPALPRETILNEIQAQGEQLLQDNCLQRYEVSAYALPGRQSIHNINYWQFGDYLGIGAGAHGKLTLPDQSTIIRTRKVKQPDHYLRNELAREANISSISQAERPLEFLLNALRLQQGFTISTFECRTGVPFSTIGKQVEYLISSQLLQQTGDRISTTTRGFQFLNNVLEEFL